MITQTLKPIIHEFKEVNKGKYKSTKHYDLLKTSNGNTLLTDKINISKNRNYAFSTPDYWLKVRLAKKWSDCITGLFKTDYPYIYFGDVDFKSHLLIFKFSENAETIKAYYFKGFYTDNINPIIEKIK